MKIYEGQLLPRGYGVAWYQPNAHVITVFPLGLHFLARWCYGFWREFHHGMAPTRIDREIAEAIVAERKRGYEVGYQDGFREGREIGRRAAVADFIAELRR